jgi:hypothetical protein
MKLTTGNEHRKRLRSGARTKSTQQNATTNFSLHFKEDSHESRMSSPFLPHLIIGMKIVS